MLAVIPVLLISILVYTFCTMSVPTGFVGVPYRFQQVVEPMMQPGGPHLYNPLTTKVILVETRPQTDIVRNVQCGTNDGVKVMLNKIEIGNLLPKEHVFSTISRFGPEYDKYLVTDLVIHQISVICSKHSAHEIAITKFDQVSTHRAIPTHPPSCCCYRHIQHVLKLFRLRVLLLRAAD